MLIFPWNVEESIEVMELWLKSHQRGYQKPWIEDGQTTQWLKEKGQKNQQRSTNHYTKNWRSSNKNPTKNRDDRMCPGRVGAVPAPLVPPAVLLLLQTDDKSWMMKGLECAYDK
jgi:hypothetical protein